MSTGGLGTYLVISFVATFCTDCYFRKVVGPNIHSFLNYHFPFYL